MRASVWPPRCFFQDFDAHSRALTNRFFLLALALMLLTLLLCFFMTWVLLRRFGQGQTAGGQILRDRAA